MNPPNEDFVDYYELLQLNPKAETDTIQRVFRMLAQRFHPDNVETGNEQIFQQMLKGYHILIDPAQRASYDAQHRAQLQVKWQVFGKSDPVNTQVEERRKREAILGVLYRKRMTHASQPGMNVREMEDLLAIPKEHLEFSLWYLKERGDIKPGDNGRFFITVHGCERYEEYTAPKPEENSGKIVYMLPPGKEERDAEREKTA